MSHDAHVAVAGLLARYAELIDAGDFAGIGALLDPARIVTDDGTLVAEGAAAIEAMYVGTTRRYPDGTPRTQHVITNLIVEDAPAGPDGSERVLARSYFTVLQATEGLSLQPIIAGRYRDTLERRGDAWVFVERAMVPTLFGDLHYHLLFDLGPADG